MVSEEKTKLVSGSSGLRKRNIKSYGSVTSVDSKTDDVDNLKSKGTFSRGECIYISLVLLIAVIGIIVGEATLIPIALDKIEKTKNCLISVDPGVFPAAAVTSDDYRCSKIGRDVLLREGSTVDAAIATMLCIGVVVPHSAGIGGGHFMTIYDKSQNEVTTLNARETAPALSNETMFFGNKNASMFGGLAIGIPGEVKGMWDAHQRFGKLPWTNLFEDAIRLSREGAKVAAPLANAIYQSRDYIINDLDLRTIFWNKNTSDVYKEGEVLKMPKLADTLHRISIGGQYEFYSGETAKILAKDIQAAGGIITTGDLEFYKTSWNKPLVATINGMSLYGPPAPSSTSLVTFILNVLEGYNLKPEDIKNTNDTVLTYHRLIEAMKYGYALRPQIADPKFANISQVQNLLMSESYANKKRSEIDDNAVHKTEEYGTNSNQADDYGTSHISILAPNGDAIAVTTSINLHFGSRVLSQSTGILLNDQMDDFSAPSNEVQPSKSENNLIQPGKRPGSSMAPLIMVNHTSGNATAVFGAAGGTHIPSTLSQVAMLELWLGKKVHEAVAEPRIHNELYPNVVQYDIGFSPDVIIGLEKKGHKMEKSAKKRVSSAANAIFHLKRCVTAAADPRKGGSKAVFGF